MRRIARLFADHVAVGLMATMFACFLLQIAFRYVLDRPLGWTEEVTVICWVWVVLWVASFILTDDEEVRFDIVYGAVGERARRVFTLVTSWADSSVQVIANGAVRKVVANVDGPADIGIDTKRNILAVPRFNAGRVDYFTIGR